jgi:hypothetical protein
MKWIAPLLLCCLSILSCSGCHSSAESPPAVEVVIDGDGQFPDSLVGTWRADSGGWEIVFEPDGTISSAVVSLGRVRMKPGQVTTVPMKLGGKGVFEAGPWAVQYSPEQRQLVVEIAIASFRVELGDSAVKGRTLNIFAGSVSADSRMWWANRFSFPEYVADTKKYRDFRLTVDPNDNRPEELLFRKVSESQ